MADNVLAEKLARLYWRAVEGALSPRETAAVESLAEDSPDRGDDVKAKAAALIADRFGQPEPAATKS